MMAGREFDKFPNHFSSFGHHACKKKKGKIYKIWNVKEWKCNSEKKGKKNWLLFLKKTVSYNCM